MEFSISNLVPGFTSLSRPRLDCNFERGPVIFFSLLLSHVT